MILQWIELEERIVHVGMLRKKWQREREREREREEEWENKRQTCIRVQNKLLTNSVSLSNKEIRERERKRVEETDN